MKLWGRQTSFNVQKVCCLLGELDLDFEHEHEHEHEHEQLGGRFGGLETDSSGAMNSHRKVPVLQDGELVVWVSHSIMRFFAATYGDEAWCPVSAATRSHIDRWLDWRATTLQPGFMALFWGYYREPQATCDGQAISAARSACTASYEVLNAQLAFRPFIAGDHLSLADIAAGATLLRYFGMELDVVQPPNIEGWYARLQVRPAHREHMMSPFAELHGRATF